MCARVHMLVFCLCMLMPSHKIYRCALPDSPNQWCAISQSHCSHLLHLNVQNVPSAFHRWLSRAEQPCAKLCLVQSSEVKLIEMNRFCYAHRGNTVGTAAEQNRCGSFVGQQVGQQVQFMHKQMELKNIFFDWGNVHILKNSVLLDCLLFIVYLFFFGFFYCKFTPLQPGKRESYLKFLVLSYFLVVKLSCGWHGGTAVSAAVRLWVQFQPQDLCPCVWVVACAFVAL